MAWGTQSFLIRCYFYLSAFSCLLAVPSSGVLIAHGGDGWTLHEEGNCGPLIRHLKITLKMQTHAAFKTHGLQRPCSLSLHHKTTVCPTAADCCNINPAFIIQKSRGMQAIYTSEISTLLQLKDLRHDVSLST